LGVAYFHAVADAESMLRLRRAKRAIRIPFVQERRWAGADTGGNLFEIYQMMDTGVALQATVAGTKYWKDTDLNK